MKRVIILIFTIFVLGYVLRVMFLPKNSLTFGYDQARDAVRSLDIAHGDLKILGPSSSTPGLYHGVLYYYVLAPAYLLGSGSPIVAAYWIALINCLTVFLVSALTYLMTKNKLATVLAALLYAISFEATQYATWLSNPTLGMFTVPLIYLSLWVWISDYKSKYYKYAPIVTGIALGFSIQSEIFLAYHMAPVLLWLFLSKSKITRQQVLSFLLALGVALSTMILSEVKFGFRGIAGFMSLLSSSDALVASRGFGDFVLLFLNELGKVYSAASYPGNVGYGMAIVVICIYFALKEKRKTISWQMFLVTWLLSHITVASLGGTSTPFLLVGISPAVSILLAIMISKILSKKYYYAGLVVLLLIVWGNISMILKENVRGSTLFSIQKDMLLSKQLSSIDYMYKNANGEPFSVNSLTSPLWVNIVWAYLFNWYGQEHNGYVPTWHGRGQEGQVIALKNDQSQLLRNYLIIEPMAGIPFQFLGSTISEEDSKNKLVSEEYFGELRIQKREYKK